MDGRVQDGFQILAGSGISEYPVAQLAAVEIAILQQILLAEDIHYLRIGFFAGLGKLMRNQVNIDHRYAKSCKNRSEEHTSELQSLMRISYAVFCLKKKK